MKNSLKVLGLDLLRAIAIISVVSGHFFLNTRFGVTTFNTPSMVLQGIVQYFTTSVGVPLFLMLTGYLNCRKKLEFSYYSRLQRVIVDYLFISIITYFVLNYSSGYSAGALIKGILSFHTINYAWYVEMYIGLFLLIPFLNVLWNELTAQYSTVQYSTVQYRDILFA